jgi:two-component system LytT family response regulator
LEKCNDAATGIKAIELHKPDLVFLDIEMPQMNGFEMLERLSQINFAIIFTTGYD